MAAMDDVPWFHFWNPQSGGLGGMIAGALISLVIIAAAAAPLALR